MWWENAVVYEVYIRSFQDTDGDGVGDLRGVTSRLQHIAELGAGALWLSPIYPSPNADFGYDVSDFLSVNPELGRLEDFDELVQSAHGLGLRVLLDFVPCHSSIEHSWFRERPEFYFWADAPPNNWRASFGGSAWERDPLTGRFYLHSFFPEQADLDWRNPELRAEMLAAMRFWLERGVDGFRLDALDRLLKDAELRNDPPAQGAPTLPLHPEHAALLHSNSRNAPDIGTALQAIRDAVGDALLVGEVYLPAAELGPYLKALDAVFAFEVLHAGANAQMLRAGIAAALTAGKCGWVLSNHDFSRLASRVRRQNSRAAALLTLSLPGPAFMLQGDELGAADARLSGAPLDRHGRDPFRAPMRWDRSDNGGFSTGTPWLSCSDEPTPSVAEQQGDIDSVLALYRRLIALRRELGREIQLLESPPETVVINRGTHLVAVNFGELECAVPVAGEIVLEARRGDGCDPALIPPHGGWVAKRIG